MAIIIKGDNNGIAVDGNLSIGNIEFALGQGIKSVSEVKLTNIEDVEFTEEDNSTIQENVAKPASTRGPRKHPLFENPDTHQENETLKNRERQRLCDYLSEHRLKSRQLVCMKDDTLNKTVVCFLKMWLDNGSISAPPSGGAVFRFLTEECGIMASVTERSYGNEIKERLNEIKTGYDTEIYLKVKKCFEV